MGAEARVYLQEHSIPQLFEGLMTGLLYNRPEDPLRFLEDAIGHIRKHPNEAVAWDTFLNNKEPHKGKQSKSKRKEPKEAVTSTKDKDKGEKSEKGEKKHSKSSKKSEEKHEKKQSVEVVEQEGEEPQQQMVLHRTPSVIRAAEVAQIPNVPVILFMGGPGGGKTRHAAKVANALSSNGLVHICMPDVIRNALSKYKDRYPEWKDANENYLRGELIPNNLALSLLKAEMGRHPDAAAFFLEGFPREARQVEDFERQVKSVNMAMILDYDERTLRDHMERRGLGMEIVDQKIKEFKQKTLPSAKYFDDQKLLHLIPGEKDDQTIYERMKGLVVRAIDTGIPVLSNQSVDEADTRLQSAQSGTTRSPKTNGSPLTRPTQSQEEVIRNESRVEVGRESVLPPINSTPPKSTSPEKEKELSRKSSKDSTALPPINNSNNSKPSSRPTSQAVARNSEKRDSASSSQRSIPPSRNSANPAADSKRIGSRQETIKTNGASTANSEERKSAVITPNQASKASTIQDAVPQSLPNNAPVVLIIGAPGSQKQDIARRVAQKYDGFTMFSMGDLLRRKVSEMKEDELWQRIGKKIDVGESVPLKICRQVLYNEIHNVGASSWGFVIEGFPRTQTQLNDMEHTLGRLDVAILIDCTEQFCMEVVRKRREAHRNARPDDEPDVLAIRMDMFKQNALPMLKYLDDKGKLRVVRGGTIDGDFDADIVFKDVSTAIDHTLFIEDDGSGKSLGDSKSN
ncbi:hypothetical protein WR25_09935 isoform A [Diploscapter pachys]|uniref:Adenylate kinase isoenzyme 5 n=3 Tax=Diploscapter pachys TaxID=2018661 RepID=A0A2A2J0X2_9BILA|nr:hypothetical protein WR25_09935 isoform A [Diploscapter pachys]